ncbi:hypothetical protein PR202_ga11793 [Eleusine coracana subsp. coracana]|uniref:DWNN domain-containing protein n=1 Tax=Eleusine coracana subsp. coracana TaxID=191504 RepID=A0AAV5CA95_ELECO|nr:hypothetical protein PR202_ga11793 [Eleusine coracana subsp. coracana]
MGVVHYRYRSVVQTFSVTVPGAFATVAELKRVIVATGRHGGGRNRGRGPREDIALPLRPPSIAIKDHAMASHKLVTESTLKPNGFAETEDEETAAISVIDAADLNWGGPSTGGGHAGGRFGSHFGHTSSSSSNLDDKSNNFTASAALKRDMKQHMDIMPSVVTECSRQVTACKNPADPCEKSAHSDLQRKTGQSATTSVKKTITTADSLGSVPKPRYQNQQPPDGVTVVSGALERKVIRTKAKRKQKTAGKTGSGNTICAEYDFQVPFDPSCYNSFEFGGPTWGCDPYNMYFMLNMPSSSYPMGLYNDNVFSNLPLHAPGMQGYPASHYRELRPTLYRDRKASAHARQAESSKGNGSIVNLQRLLTGCPRVTSMDGHWIVTREEAIGSPVHEAVGSAFHARDGQWLWRKWKLSAPRSTRQDRWFCDRQRDASR